MSEEQAPKCVLGEELCGRKATVLDTEYDEYYCDKHAAEYQVFDGPHKILED